MKMDEYPHREFCEREHRIIGNYLSIYSWIKQLDCLVLDRKDVEEFLNIKTIRKERLKWFIYDINAWFPYIEVYSKNGTRLHFQLQCRTLSSNSVGSLFLSRSPIDDGLPINASEARNIIIDLNKKGIKTEVFLKRKFELMGLYKLGKNTKRVPSIQIMVTITSLLASGLENPAKYFKIK